MRLRHHIRHLPRQQLHTHVLHRWVEGRCARLVEVRSSCRSTSPTSQSDCVIVSADLLLVCLVHSARHIGRYIKLIGSNFLHTCFEACLRDGLLTLIVCHECTGLRSLSVNSVHSSVGLARTWRLEHVVGILAGDRTCVPGLPLLLELCIISAIAWHQLYVWTHLPFDNFRGCDYRAVSLLHGLNHWIVTHVVRHAELVGSHAGKCGISTVVKWI